MLVPRRRRGVEWLDDPATDPAVRVRSIADVVRSNRILGGRRAAAHAIGAALRAVRGSTVTLLDVGTGLADIPRQARDDVRARGRSLVTVGLDSAPSLLLETRATLSHAVCGSALAIPLRDASVDVVSASQFLHHFEGDEARSVLREMDRVARHAVVVCDLRRSWLAAVGFWLLSWPLRFHPVTRHDGVVSVLRGFTAAELTTMIQDAVGRPPTISRQLGFRLTATWTPSAVL
jgi:hypothetical protein